MVAQGATSKGEDQRQTGCISIQDDLRRAANEERLRTSQRMAELGTIKDEMKSVATNLALRAPGFMRRGVSVNVAPSLH